MTPGSLPVVCAHVPTHLRDFTNFHWFPCSLPAGRNRSKDECSRYELHYNLQHVDSSGHARILFVDFSSAFTTTNTAVLHSKLVKEQEIRKLDNFSEKFCVPDALCQIAKPLVPFLSKDYSPVSQRPSGFKQRPHNIIKARVSVFLFALV